LFQTDLFKFLHNESTQITEHEKTTIALDIAEGILAMHERQIVHRDIKSPNILLNTTNSQGKPELTAVIADFGMAKTYTSQIENQVFVNLQGMSPRYTAPEVFTRINSRVKNVPFELELKTDIYSFAVIVWEIMTRRNPWANCNTTAEIESNVVQGKREDIPRTNQGLASIVEMCWVQNPVCKDAESLRFRGSMVAITDKAGFSQDEFLKDNHGARQRLAF